LGVIDVTTSVVRAAVSVGLALAGLDGEALVLGSLAGALVLAGMAWAGAPAPLPRLRRDAARDVLDYGMPASLAAVSWVGFRNCDYAIVGARLGALQAGYYFRAYSVAVEYQKKISLVMVTVGFPVLSRAESAERMASMRGQMVRLLTIVLFPLLALLAIVAPVFMPWLFGAAWAPAVVPIQILALGGAATLVIDAIGTALMAQGRPRALLGYGVGHFAVYALAAFAVAPLGLAAVAVAAAVVHTLFLVVAYLLMLWGSREPALRCLWDDVAPATVSCLGLAAAAVPIDLVLSAAHVPAMLHLVAVLVVAVPAYLLTLRGCYPATWRHVRGLMQQIVPHERLRRNSRRPAVALDAPADS
jgi:O-antigen/teichoic acid export membrane protein